ncbi:hypothetical protein CCZ27_06580 [Thauera sinica]|nr:hypothetical protein CCZ27_06580 [Thauera sp. K11]
MNSLWTDAGVRAVLAGMVVFAGAGEALSHAPDHSNVPLLRCWNDGDAVVCESRWSMGSALPNASLDVLGRGGEVLSSVRTDASGRARFARPEGEFGVLMYGVGIDGQTVDVDRRDIDATPPPARPGS